MENPQQLRAEADAVDRKADAIFERMDAAPANAHGIRPLIPAGMEAEAARAGDLRASARTLRQEAAEIEAEARASNQIKKAEGVSSSPRGPVASPAPASTGVGAGNTPPVPAPNAEAEIEAAAKRILASDGPAEMSASGDAEVDALAARIAASDADPEADDADAVAARIAAA